MERRGNHKDISRDQKCMSHAETKSTPRTRQGTKLRDILLSNKPNLSYADFHHEITRNPEDALPKYVGSQQSQVLDKRISKEDELVRYMSNLPSYLEKGKNFQDKGLNVGVLDWRRLEKWRYSQKQMPTKHSGCSPSSSPASLFSTDGSSTYSSRGPSCSPSCQRLHRLSLQSPLEASPKEAHVQDAKSSSGRGHSCSPARQRTHSIVPQSHPQKVYAGGRTSPEIEVFGGNSQKFQDSTDTTGNNLSRQQKVFGAVQSRERKVSDLNCVSELGKLQTFDKYEVAAPWKGKSKIQDMESAKATTRSHDTKLSVANQDSSGRGKSGIVVTPRDLSEHRCSSVTDMSNFIVDGRLSVEPCQKSFLVRNNHEAQLPSKPDHRRHLKPSESCSQYPDGVKSSSQQSNVSLHSAKIGHHSSNASAKGVKGAPQASSHVLPFPARMLSSPTRNRNAEEMKPVAGSRSASAVKSFEKLDARRSSSSESVPKERHQSPIRRLSSAMGKMIKNAGSRDNSPHRSRSTTKERAAKPGSEAVVTAVSLDNPCSDKLFTNNSRGRSSPLRRLFDPLLKPRASNSSEPSKKQASTVDTINSCNDPIDFRLGPSMKVNSRSTSGTKKCTTDPLQSQNDSSQFQALLQVSYKNGLPLFTFAIDNESNILAATVRKSSIPGKGHHSWTYTFFTIREVKRKSGIWLNQGGKDGHGYVPNVVAQMKVSDSSGSFNIVDHNITREFGLFAVDVGHGDQYATDFHPTNDLAAIVVKLPKIAAGNASKHDLGYSWLDLPQDTRENSQEIGSADSSDHSQFQHSLISLNLNTTVILPGGVHTVPSKGEISRLAERWRSGGSCDCGGWDLGCQLRVYSNQKEYQRKMGSSGISGFSLNKDKFQIFSQGNQDNHPVLSLVPFKERIYSVEFSSSFSLLQAFAVCISYIDCRRPSELFDHCSVEKISNEAGVFEVAMRTKTSNQGEAPAKYVSYPPHSPVGRV